MFKIMVDDLNQVESWGESQWETRSEAWDAFLRVLDHYNGIPGWATLDFSHRRFNNCENVRINGVSLIVVADVETP